MGVRCARGRYREGAAAELKKAEKWLKEAQADIRAERFRPIADKARAVWEDLRQSSNVELVDIQLAGSATARRTVALDVTVDGVEGAALGVMSQGELNALALSLFMPRAVAAGEPVPLHGHRRSRAVDGPCPHRRSCAGPRTALPRSRQVVVFTHDDRLPEAIRHLGLAANVIEVMRRPGSIVETRDARTTRPGISRRRADAGEDDRSCPRPYAGAIVPGFCRSALEAACMDAVRGRRLERGEPHAAIEELLRTQTTLNKLAALALFDDGERAGDVMRAIE